MSASALTPEAVFQFSHELLRLHVPDPGSGAFQYGAFLDQPTGAGLPLLHAVSCLRLFLAMLPVSVLGFFTPGGLIDICKMNTMRCVALIKPAMTILCALAAAVALVGWLVERKRQG